MTFILRPYRASDLDALYAICLATGDSGQDASELYAYPQLLGDLYAAPYAALEPELTFVLADEAGVCGYILGTADTCAFERWFAEVWAPSARARYPAPERAPERDAKLIARLGRPQSELPTAFDLDRYPAHLHIDLLPRAQRQGQGRRLMERFLTALRERGVPGVHLGLGARNERAYRFYRRMGFAELFRDDKAITMGLGLEP